MEKTVEMKATKGAKVQEEKKLSYKDLEKVAQQLSAQCQQMAQRIQSQNMELTFRRLDYLFKVIESSTMFPDDFVKKSVDEIIEIMSPNVETVEE